MIRRRLVLPVLFGLACLATLSPEAHGGAYNVRACHADGVNAVFSPSYTAGAVAFPECPGGVNGNVGLIVRNVDRAEPVGGFTSAAYTVNAPAGTYIDGIQFVGQVVNNSYWQSGLYDAQHGAWVWCGPGCGTVPFWSPFSASGFATTSLKILTICGSAQCNARGVQGAVMVTSATLRLQDVWNPSVSIVGGSLASDGWKSGVQTVEVAGSDNTGVRVLRSYADSELKDTRFGTCDDHALVPCPPSFQRVLGIDTREVSDGAHALIVEAEDAGGNVARANRSFVVDNTPPDPPDDLVAREEWRATNAFDIAWTNPPRGVGSPIAGAAFQFCNIAGTAQGCQGIQHASKVALASLTGLKVPGPGAWRLRIWLIDAAGNQNPQTFREVTLRWDADPPSISLLPRTEDDPTRIRVQAADATSGIATAEIEVRRGDDSTWHALPVELTDDGFTAVVDDESLPPGSYAIRARVRDRAGNEKTADGASIRLPVRVATELAVGKSTFLRANRAGPRGHRVLIRKPRTRYGRTMKLTGRLTTPGGNPLAGRDVEVSEQPKITGADWKPVATVRTGVSGRFAFKALPGPSRLLRFRYPGTATILGQTSIVDLRVRATSSIRVNRRRVVNGEAVRFTGTVPGGPLPTVGKLLQLQVFARAGWLTFATPRADARGNWRHEYRFTATRGATRYRFRARIPREAGYPYEAGASKPVKVKVVGL